MKLYEIAMPKSEDDVNDEHITAATYMRVMRPVFPEAKFSTSGQPRNTKTAKIVSIMVEIPVASRPDAQKAFVIIEQEVKRMKGVVSYKVTPSPSWTGQNGGDVYIIQVGTAFLGIAKERMDFINDIKTRIKAMKPRVLTCSAENHKDGAYVMISRNIMAIIAAGPHTDQAARDAAAAVADEALAEFIDDLIERYGDRLQVDMLDWYAKVSYH